MREHGDDAKFNDSWDEGAASWMWWGEMRLDGGVRLRGRT